MLVSHANWVKMSECLSSITSFCATENLGENTSFLFKDDIDAGRECLIKGLCIYLNENPNVLVQEYTVSVL